MKRALAAVLSAVCGFVLIACASGGDSGGGSSCGNGVKDGADACDGQDFGGLTCQTLGFKSGTLSCDAATCQLNPATCCNDTCVNVGDTQCQGTILQTCSQQGGCRAWTQTTDCAQGGGLCEATAGKAACTTSCVNACPTIGATQCNAGAIEVCQTNSSKGCNEWVQIDDCAAKGQSCDASSGIAVCGAACNNQCTKAGDTQCSGNVLRTCQQGTDGCLTLVTTTDCAAQGQACTTPGGVAQCTFACNNKCSAVGTQNCVGNVLSTCATDTNGCLDWQQTEDCSATSKFCKLAGAGKAKCEGICTNPCPTLNEKKCNANLIQECKVGINGCQDWQVATTCPLGQKCEQSGTNYSCVAGGVTAEDCGGVVPIQAGKNTINWTATKNDYLNPVPTSCASSSYTVQGPDLVMVYQAGFTGSLEYSVEKPLSTYYLVAVSSGNCGAVGTPLACSAIKDYSLTSVSGSLSVTKGTTYFFYVGKLSGTANLNNPLVITLAEVDCSVFSASALTLTPANGATTSTLKPTLTADFDVPVVTTSAWTVKITGNKGTNITYTYPNSAVTWTNNNKTMNINPGITFPAGEVVTVDVSGLTDSKCTKPINKPTWQFTVITPPCAPGTGGMLGSTVTKVGGPSGTWYYMATDQNANGSLYLGNTSTLYQITKGSWIQTPTTALSTYLGYNLFMNGAEPMSNKYTSTGTTGWVYRLIPPPSGWSTQDFVTFPQTPGDYIRSGVVYKGKIYLMTTEYSTTSNHEIWSANAAPPSMPNSATQEGTFSGEAYCSGLAVDDKYFYTVCGTGERLVRIDRTTKTVTLITNAFDMGASSYSNVVHAHDTNNDGTADFLYYKGYRAEVYFVCNPAGTTPYADVLANYGTSTSAYGLAFDATNKKLYAWDNSAYQIVQIQ